MPDPSTSMLVAPCPCGSMKRFIDCHGTALIPAIAEFERKPQSDVERLIAAAGGVTGNTQGFSPGVSAYPIPRYFTTHPTTGEVLGLNVHPPIIVPMAPAPVTRKLDLACGQSTKEGFEGADIWPGAQHVVNLQQYPWPFEDNSVLEIHCSHYIEHIPMQSVLQGDLSEEWSLKDALFAFFDECWRILVPDGWMTVQWPCHRSDRAFQDPTHRRFPTAQTMAYMNEEWRRANKLDHYNVECNFIGDCNPVVDQALTLRPAEVAQKKMQLEWNTIFDWVGKLQKKPRLPKVS